MNIAKNLVENVPIAKAISQARDNITEGQSIAEPLRRSGEFPSMMVPLNRTKNDEIVTAYDMKAVEKMGLLKMDFRDWRR